MTQRYPDEYLNHWADVYVDRKLKRRGITLEQFLVAPHQMLARVTRMEAADHTAREPIQPRCQRRAEASLRQRGPVLMQKLWHGSRRRNRADAPLPSRR